MIVTPKLPRRPEPTDPRAKQVVEWAEVIFYVFGLAFTAAMWVIGLVEYAPSAINLLTSR